MDPDLRLSKSNIRLTKKRKSEESSCKTAKSLSGVGQPHCERTKPGNEFSLRKGESVGSNSSDDEGRSLDELVLSVGVLGLRHGVR